MKMLVTIYVLILLTATIGCQHSDSTTTQPSASTTLADSETPQQVIDVAADPMAKPNVESNVDHSSDSGIANELNWEIFKDRLRNYETNKENDNEDDR